MFFEPPPKVYCMKSGSRGCMAFHLIRFTNTLHADRWMCRAFQWSFASQAYEPSAEHPFTPVVTWWYGLFVVFEAGATYRYFPLVVSQNHQILPNSKTQEINWRNQTSLKKIPILCCTLVIISLFLSVIAARLIRQRWTVKMDEGREIKELENRKRICYIMMTKERLL